MQDSVGGENNRTSVIYQVSDTYCFVGDINGQAYIKTVEMISRGDLPCGGHCRKPKSMNRI